MPEPVPQSPRLRPIGPIVTAAEIAIWSEADAALAACERYREESRAWIAASAERERRRGFVEGRVAGSEEAARIVAETSAKAAAYLASLERDLPEFVLEIIADILGKFHETELIAQSIRNALTRLQPGHEAVLRVAPAQVDAMSAALAEFDAREAIRIEPDPALAPGECHLRSAFGNVELGIEAQLRALRVGLTRPASDPT